MVSSLGSVHSSVLSNSRIPYAMARDRLAPRALAALSPRSRVPRRALIAQGVWGSVLTLSGSYDSLTDAAMFAAWLFYGLTAAALFVLRGREPDAQRSFQVPGYPWLPLVFVVVTVALLINTFIATPREALFGSALLLLGLPFYAYWSRRSAAPVASAARTSD
jgi:APA family basic amino acid/polyamine antiporter